MGQQTTDLPTDNGLINVQRKLCLALHRLLLADSRFGAFFLLYIEKQDKKIVITSRNGSTGPRFVTHVITSLLHNARGRYIVPGEASYHCCTFLVKIRPGAARKARRQSHPSPQKFTCSPEPVADHSTTNHPHQLREV